MNILNNLFHRKKDTTTSKHNIYLTELSQYSPLPRYYYIKGNLYDIDSPNSVSSIPVCETHFNINGEDWGIDTILRLHVNKYHYNIPNDLKASCYPKIAEIEASGLRINSEEENEAQLKHEHDEKELKNKLMSISLKDMEQFKALPYKMDSPFYYNRMSIMLISAENKTQVKQDIQYINNFTKRACTLYGIKESLEINTDTLKFDTYFSVQTDSREYFTYLQCNPYTKTGKLSKFPLILHYASATYLEPHPDKNFFGEIYYMQNGCIGKTRLIYWIMHTMYLFEMAIMDNKTLVIKKIEKSIDGNKELIYKL